MKIAVFISKLKPKFDQRTRQTWSSIYCKKCNRVVINTSDKWIGKHPCRNDDTIVHIFNFALG